MLKRFRFGGQDSITNPNPNIIRLEKNHESESEYSGFGGKDSNPNPNPNIRYNTDTSPGQRRFTSNASSEIFHIPYYVMFPLLLITYFPRIYI